MMMSTASEAKSDRGPWHQDKTYCWWSIRFQPGVRESVAISYQLESIWKTYTDQPVLYRYIGTSEGVYRVYPAVAVSLIYDQTTEPWLVTTQNPFCHRSVLYHCCSLTSRSTIKYWLTGIAKPRFTEFRWFRRISHFAMSRLWNPDSSNLASPNPESLKVRFGFARTRRCVET